MSRTLAALLTVVLATTQPLQAEDELPAAAAPIAEEADAAEVEPAAQPSPSEGLPAEVAPPTATEVPFVATPQAVQESVPAPVPGLAAAVPSRDAQELEYEIHRLLAIAAVIDDERSVPAAQRLDLYLQLAGVGRWTLGELTLAFDDAAPQALTLDTASVAAVAAEDGTLRLARLPITNGAQRLRLSVRLQKAGDEAPQERALTAEFRFDGARGPVELVAQVEAGTLGSPGLRLQQRVASEQASGQLLGIELGGLSGSRRRYQPGDDADPALNHARGLLAQGDSRAALVELLSIAERRRLPSGALPNFASPYWLQTAALLREEGLLDRAQTICDELAPRRAIRRELAIERLAIGEARLAVGDLEGAEQQFTRARPGLPEYRLPDLRTATGMLQLAQQRSREASETLGASTSDSVEAFRYMSSSVEALRATAYGRYNLAIATLRSGDAKTALSWLDLLGRSDSADPELLALRDKANLALGWHFLEQKQGRTALGALGRVRSEGLASNRALLGMGWAQLAPAGERLKRTQLGRTVSRAPDQIGDLPAPVRNSLERLRVLEPELGGSGIGPSSFERDDPPKDRREGLQRALQIWAVLIERDERDPAVQEAKLAVAYAHDQLRDSQAARDAYGLAIDSLRKVDTAIDAETLFASDGELRTALTTMTDRRTLFETLDRLHMPPEPSIFPLYAKLERLQQRNRLQQALTQARRQLELPAPGNLSAPADLIARLGTFDSWLGKQRGTLADEAEATIKSRLMTRRATTRDYLKTALLSLARLEDVPSLDNRADTPSCLDGGCP